MRKKSGFTLIELLIVIGILAFLIVLAFFVFATQIAKGYDSRRKSDLAKIKLAFEDYYNDKGCYPPDSPPGSNILVNCGSNQFAPYLKVILCDPKLNTPYKYVPVSSDGCSGYRLCAKIEDRTDPDIRKQGCDPVKGCGWGVGYNYCLTSGVSAVNPAGLDSGSESGGEVGGPTAVPSQTPMPGVTASPTPTAGSASPTPTPESALGQYEGVYACSAGVKFLGIVLVSGECNNYGSQAAAVASGCPASFSSNICDNHCGDAAYWCP